MNFDSIPGVQVANPNVVADRGVPGQTFKKRREQQA